MEKILLLAEEGERKLIDEVSERLGEAFQRWIANYEVHITGVGALNVLHALRSVPTDTDILNIGYAGSANFDLGMLVSVLEVRLNHPCVSYPEPVQLLQPLPFDAAVQQAVCYTNTDFVLQSDYRDCVFDMELAYICALGFRSVRSLKVVSDNLSLHTYHTVANGVD